MRYRTRSLSSEHTYRASCCKEKWTLSVTNWPSYARTPLFRFVSICYTTCRYNKSIMYNKLYYKSATSEHLKVSDVNKSITSPQQIEGRRTSLSPQHKYCKLRTSTDDSPVYHVERPALLSASSVATGGVGHVPPTQSRELPKLPDHLAHQRLMQFS